MSVSRHEFRITAHQRKVRSELAFTTFFARYVGLDEDPAEFDKWFEQGEITTSKNVAKLFSRAKDLGVAICVGYGEKTEDGRHFNSCSYVDGAGIEVSKVGMVLQESSR